MNFKSGCSWLNEDTDKTNNRDMGETFVTMDQVCHDGLQTTHDNKVKKKVSNEQFVLRCRQ